MTAKTKRVTDCQDVVIAKVAWGGDYIKWNGRVLVIQVDSWRSGLGVQGQHSEDGLNSARATQQVARRRLCSRDGDVAQMVAKNSL